eukprot:403366810
MIIIIISYLLNIPSTSLTNIFLTFLTTSAARQKVFKKSKTICKPKKKLPTLIDLTISSDEDEKSVITIHSVNSDLPENINNLDSTQSTAENSDSTQTSLHSRRSASPEKQPQQPQEILNDMTVVDPLSQINFTVKNIQARRQKKAQRLNCIRIGSFYQAKIPEFQNVICINNSELKQSDQKIDQQILWDPSKISDTNLENYLQHAKQYHPTDIKYREDVVLDFLVDQQYNSQSLLQNIQLFQQLLNYYVRIRDSARLTKKIVNKDEDNYNKRYGRF